MDVSTVSPQALWAFFSLWIAIILFTVFVVNVRRRRRGQNPIVGTAWLSPPSYGQSQRHYNQAPEQTTIVAPVPEYTAQPNADVDLGYYDQRGRFHPASPSLVKPEPAAAPNTARTSTTYAAAPVDQIPGEAANFVRPSGPPPVTTGGGADRDPAAERENRGENSVQPARPDHPPPNLGVSAGTPNEAFVPPANAGSLPGVTAAGDGYYGHTPSHDSRPAT